MKQPINWSVLALMLWGSAASAASDDAAKLAELTAKNISMMATTLASHQKGLNEIAATRAASIVSVNRLAIVARHEVVREVSILNQTGGAEIVKLFDALCEHGDKATLVFGQIEAAEAAAKAEVAAAYVPMAIATDKLERAAKSLSLLAKQESDMDRAKSLLKFAQDVRDEAAKLSKDSATKRASADQKLKLTVASTTASAAATTEAAANPK